MGPHQSMPQACEPVKGHVSLGSDCVCSRDARNRFVPPVPKLDTAAPSAGPQPDAGGEDEPASSIGRPPTVERNARPRTGRYRSSCAERQRADEAQDSLQSAPEPQCAVRCPAVRGPAPSHGIRIFLLRSSRVRRAFPTPSSDLVRGGFAALPAVRLCVASSSENDDGNSGHIAVGTQRVDGSFPRTVS